MPSTIAGYQKFAKQIHDSDFTPDTQDHDSMVAELAEGYRACGGVIPTRVNFKSPYAWRQLIQAMMAPKINTPIKDSALPATPAPAYA